MNINIRTKLFGCNTKGNIDMLRKIGFDFTYKETYNKTIFVIELREAISILELLKLTGYFDWRQDSGEIWDLNNITEYGISIYMASIAGDGSVFIPMNNIIAIHTISCEQLMEIKNNDIKMS